MWPGELAGSARAAVLSSKGVGVKFRAKLHTEAGTAGGAEGHTVWGKGFAGVATFHSC